MKCELPPWPLRTLLLTLSFVSSLIPSGAVSGAVPVPSPGWSLELIAQAPRIRHPSVVCVAPDGRVFVAEDPMDISSKSASAQEGRIVCLQPDGRTTVFADKLFAVFGMQYLEGKLYVLQNPKFSVFRDDDGVGRDRTELIEQTNPEPWAQDWNDHVPSNFRLAMDGYFYLAVGDKGLYGAVDRSGTRVDLQGGGVVRIRPDGTGLEIVSRGVRNILDVAVDAEDELFTYDNTDENQWMGRLTHMVDGGVYGYPFDFIPRRAYTLWMFADYGPGAACGALAYNDDALPPEYGGSLFLADFGQRNLRRVLLERAGGTFRAVRDQLLFPDPPPDFRPVGIHETSDGRGFYICDWQHQDNKQDVIVGRLWKLTASFATNAAPLPAWYRPVALGLPADPAIPDLVAGLAHPRKLVRLTAQRALVRHGPRAETALRATLSDPKARPTTRSHALWALDALDQGLSARAQVIQAVSASPPILARQAMRQLGQRKALEGVPALVARLDDADPSLRFHAATALGRIEATHAVPPLLRRLALPEPELWPRFAMFTALNRIGRAHPDAWAEMVGALASGPPASRESLTFALRDTFDLALVDALIGAMTNRTASAGTRESALGLLRLAHRKPAPWKGSWWSYHPFRLSAPARTNSWEGTARVGAALRAALEDPEERLRLAAIEAAGEVGDTGAIPKLRQLWSDPAPAAIRRAVVPALGELGDASFVPVLLELARDPRTEPELRLIAIRAAARLWDKAPATRAELGIALLDWLGPAQLPAVARREAIVMVERVRFTNAVVPLMELARSTDPAEREAAVRALGALGGTVSLEALSALAARAPLETRRDALVALGHGRHKAALPLLIQAARDEATRDAAWRALAAMPALEALDSYLEALNSPEVVVRDRARRAFEQIRQEALAELDKRGKQLSLSPRVRSELRRVYQNEPDNLKKAFLQAAGSEALPAPEDYARYALAHPGDPWRGQRIFFEEQRTACVRCHAVHGWGGGVGPEMTTAGAQFGRAALIESVLFPSKAVREGYQQVEIDLKSGESFSGILKAESVTDVILLDSESRSQTMARDQIVSRRNSSLSLMPEGLHAALSLEEFADLVGYIESLKTDPRRTAPPPLPTGCESLTPGPGLEGWHHWNAVSRSAVPPLRDWVRLGTAIEGSPAGEILWSDRLLTNFTVRFEWRWVDPPQFKERPIVDKQGQAERGEAGVVLVDRVLDAGEASLVLRGALGPTVSLSGDPTGSGALTLKPSEAKPGEVQAFLARARMDRPLGQWNQMEIVVRGDSVRVGLNGTEVIPAIPLRGLPPAGELGLQCRAGRIQVRAIAVSGLD